MTDRRLEEKPACSVKAAPFPAEEICPHCGKENEIWSDEAEANCRTCGKLIDNKNSGI